MNEPSTCICIPDDDGGACIRENCGCACHKPAPTSSTPEPKCPKCGAVATYQTPDGTYWDGMAHYWKAEPRKFKGFVTFGCGKHPRNAQGGSGYDLDCLDCQRQPAVVWWEGETPVRPVAPQPAPSSPSPQRAKCDGCGADYDPKFAETTCIVCDGIIQPPVAQPTPVESTGLEEQAREWLWTYRWSSERHHSRPLSTQVSTKFCTTEKLLAAFAAHISQEKDVQLAEAKRMANANNTSLKYTAEELDAAKVRITQLEKGAEGLVKMLEDATDRLEVFAHAKSTVLLDPTKKHEAKYFDTWKRHCEEAYSLIERSRAALLEYQKIKGTK